MRLLTFVFACVVATTAFADAQLIGGRAYEQRTAPIAITQCQTLGAQSTLLLTFVPHVDLQSVLFRVDLYGIDGRFEASRSVAMDGRFSAGTSIRVASYGLMRPQYEPHFSGDRFDSLRCGLIEAKTKDGHRWTAARNAFDLWNPFGDLGASGTF